MDFDSYNLQVIINDFVYIYSKKVKNQLTNFTR